jgi:hypothetical protein
MARGLRSAVQTSGIIVASFLLASLTLSVVLLYTNGDTEMPNAPLHKWWLIYGEDPLPLAHQIWNIGGLFYLLLFSLGAAFLLRRLYQRTASAEAFFFFFFLLSTFFEAFRFWNLFTVLRQAPVFFNILLSRITHWGRFFGYSSLLMASLCAVEVRYQRFGLLLLAAMLLALMLAYSIPLDSSILLANFLLKLGDEPAVLFAVMAMVLFSLINFFLAAYRRKNRRYLLVALAVAVVLGARDFYLFTASPVRIIVGMILVPVGVLFFVRQVDRIYQWG